VRPVDTSVIPDGLLAVLTARDVSPDSRPHMADFKDIHALSHGGHLLGMSASGEIRYGMRPLSMIDGVWYMREDLRSQEGKKDVHPALDELSLEVVG